MTPQSVRVALLLFASGFCALIYQTTWLREFRLVFGVSTAASAVVIGVFMLGVGFGGLVLGRRSERSARPLLFYARLELLIAITAGLSPFLILIARHFYIELGGVPAMGIVLSTVIRIMLAVVIIGTPTFLMGGTLPAAAGAAVAEQDISRRGVGLLYGTNTLGAVAGAFAGTFYCFERFGNRLTLWAAAALNILVAAIAFYISKSSEVQTQGEPPPPHDGTANSKLPRRFILVAAGLVGFAFFLMELVWYRMLGPLLGGSTFSFGLILAVALFGIGAGGVAYSVVDPKRTASLGLFGFTCAAEALFVALPYALGDRFAVATMLLRPLGTMGFYGHVMAWIVLCLIAIFPAAFFAGFQFPVLISLLGRGRRRVGSQIGLAYAWNTVGALLGSLAGGFGLMPLLSAPGVWRLAIVLLGLVAVVAVLVDFAQHRDWKRPVPSILVLTPTLLSLAALGPTAFWRHSEIGVGRLTTYQATPNQLRDLVYQNRRKIFWEKDGIESSVALAGLSGISFFINGRSDGNAKADAGTQIMSGLIGSAVHPGPTKAMVVGLGTGSTAGWLAAVPTIERVDVVELEPAIRSVAQACAAVNHDALSNPKLHLTIGDARELLLTTREKYDVIASEPSNPYRAGVAGVFTREFYQSVERCLNQNGIFCQWVQAYDIDNPTVQTIYRTLRSVFGSVESWQTDAADLVLVASRQPIQYHMDQLRTRLTEEPYKSAILHAWRGYGLEDFLGHYLGNPSVADAMASGDWQLNTDDRTVIEFGLARAVGQYNGFRLLDLRAAAHRSYADRPLLFDGTVDWPMVEESRLSMYVPPYPPTELQDRFSPAEQSRVLAFVNYVGDDLPQAWQQWRNQSAEPRTLPQLTLVAECLAAQGDDSALPYIEKLASLLPIDAQLIRARLLLRQGNTSEAADILESVFNSLRHDPWLPFGLTKRALAMAGEIGRTSSNSRATSLYNALRETFAARNEDGDRLTMLFNLGMRIDGRDHPADYTLHAIELVEPWVPWQLNFLHVRELCYIAMDRPKRQQAQRDFSDFVKNEPESIEVMSKQIDAVGHDAATR